MHTFSTSLAKVMIPFPCHSPTVKATTHFANDASRADPAQSHGVQGLGSETINDQACDDYILTDLSQGNAQVHFEPLDMRLEAYDQTDMQLGAYDQTDMRLEACARTDFRLGAYDQTDMRLGAYDQTDMRLGAYDQTDMRLGTCAQVSNRLVEDEETFNRVRHITSLENLREERQQQSTRTFERELTTEISVSPCGFAFDSETPRSSKVMDNHSKGTSDERSGLDGADGAERFYATLSSPSSQESQDSADKRSSSSPTLTRMKPKDAATITLPPCRICGSKASGFHYGVNSCEACKGFFRRALRRPMVFCCTKNRTCDVKGNKRSSCRFCRYTRCVSLGMSREAIKTGRYSHKKRTDDTIEVKRLQNTPNALTDASEMDAILKRLFEADVALLTSTAHTPEHALYKKQVEYNNVHTLHKQLGHLASQKVCQENKHSSVPLEESSARWPNSNASSKSDGERRIFLFRTNLPETYKTSQNPLDEQRHNSNVLYRALGGKDHTDKSLRYKTELIGRSEARTPMISAQHHGHLRTPRNMSVTQANPGPSLWSRVCSSDGRRAYSNFSDQSLRSTSSQARRHSQTGNDADKCHRESGTSKGFSEISGADNRVGNARNISLLDIGKIKQAGYFNQRDVNSLRRYDVVHTVSNVEGSRRPTSLRVGVRSSVPESPGASLPESTRASVFGGKRASLPESSRESVPDGARAPVQDSPISKARNGKPWLGSCEACNESKTDVIARAENWVMGYIGFAKAIPGFSSLVPQDQATLLRHAWDEVWILGAYRGYNSELGVAVMPSGKCFHSEEMEKGWGRGYARLAFDLANILKRNNLTSNLVTLLKAICIVSPDRCDLVKRREVEDLQWTLVACLLHHMEATQPGDRTAFPRLVAILTSLRQLSEAAQSTMDTAGVEAMFGCNILSDIFAPF